MGRIAFVLPLVVACAHATVRPPTVSCVPPTPRVRATKEVDGLKRIAGDPDIEPPGEVKDAMWKHHLSGLQLALNVCIDECGTPTQADVLMPSAVPRYDTLVQHTILADWRYEPYVVDGKPTPVCQQVIFTIHML